ncbi:fungal-specific transcription factor domain-containing protein [Phascolomyces articulosus]|uniref:Fungal-specific transcription factor domain-containing protein n=1 Tax=Phascolomyces articulosus TaxID=60185 RepID=A0AAD5K5J4_9FUNG|nr:fungal-specific transcription factor domain-containing protein [Phascolomyces articulosus]
MRGHEGSDDSQSIVGKKRVRATQACILCRKKKIKCDGTKPECLHCQEANITCEYSECRKRGPRKGYVQLLEERLAQLERRLSTDDAASEKKKLSVPAETGALYDPHALLRLEPRRGIEINDTESIPKSLSSGSNNINNDDEFNPSMDLVMHLVDLFFQHLNSVFPLVHRRTLKQSIRNGTVSKPLLWSVMGIGARFSDHPSIRADPPYWAGERFAIKATSLIDATMLEPTIPNLQFWGIMACLEYGRASGSRAWIYGGLAVRICQELGLNKEETLSSPILKKDGSVDSAAMALRRRIFFSVYCLDKFASAGTSRPQYFDTSDCDAALPNVTESVLLRDLFQCTNIDGKELTNDSLMDITRHYLRMVTIFGESNKFMTKAKSDSESVTWPPVPEFNNLDARLRSWKSDLPERFQFSLNNLSIHKRGASRNYLTLWLSTHAVWCTTMMVLHRGSLAYSEVQPSDVPEDLYRRIQASINCCKVSIDEAMIIFRALKELSGPNVLPYMGYSAYICATVLMTSTFSKDAESFKKSASALRILYAMIDGLAPYWPMCERLALTTRDLLLTHSRLYDNQYRQDYYSKPSNTGSTISTATTLTPSSQASATTPSPASTTGENADTSVTTTETEKHKQSTPQEKKRSQSQSQSQAQQQPQGEENTQAQLQHLPSQPQATLAPPPPSSTGIALQATIADSRNPLAQQQSALPLLAESFPFTTSEGEIDFNSSEFLYDSALFGQIMFDATKPESSAQAGSSAAAGAHLQMNGYPSVYMGDAPVFPNDIIHNNTNPINITSPTGQSSPSVDKTE